MSAGCFGFGQGQGIQARDSYSRACPATFRALILNESPRHPVWTPNCTIDIRWLGLYLNQSQTADDDVAGLMQSCF
jgi:hypothetical protein